MDISRFLIEVLDVHFDAQAAGKPIKVTYHDPCHLKRTPSGKTYPRELLKRMAPKYEFVEMEFADSCCGAAGSFNIAHYPISQKIGAKKFKAAKESGADIVATACPSCLMQIAGGLREEKHMQVKHIAELAASCLPEK